MKLAIPGTHTERASLYHCDFATLAAAMREAGTVADALIVDAPYSERTHAGHDDGTASANRMAHFASTRGGQQKDRAYAARKAARGATHRETLDYAAWDGEDVSAFVRAFAPSVRGWICSLTDHALAGAWEVAMVGAERYVFSPLACVESGSRVRLGGDGPSQWSTWLVTSRPRTREWQSWGTLPGAYVGTSEKKPITGGKPLWLMRAIVGDYSRPGDLVLDPCAGGGTTLVAAVELGRRAIGCEPDAGRYAIAAKRILAAREQRVLSLDVAPTGGEQTALVER